MFLLNTYLGETNWLPCLVRRPGPALESEEVAEQGADEVLVEEDAGLGVPDKEGEGRHAGQVGVAQKHLGLTNKY